MGLAEGVGHLPRLLRIRRDLIRRFAAWAPDVLVGIDSPDFNLGLEEQIIFPEVDYDKVERVKGMTITIVTSARNDEEGQALLKGMGFPFRD